MATFKKFNKDKRPKRNTQSLLFKRKRFCRFTVAGEVWNAGVGVVSWEGTFSCGEFSCSCVIVGGVRSSSLIK